MSGTNHSAGDDWHGPQPVFILTNPQMGENIGASARAMWNFGLESLRLVAPRDGWPNPKAEVMSSGAGRVLQGITPYPTLADCTKDLNTIFATTARKRDLTQIILSPEDAMAEAYRLTSLGQKIGIVFGPERAGLENTDIVRANALITIPVNPAFASLNLAQSVGLLAYEWQRARMRDAGDAPAALFPTRAEAGEIETLASNLESQLDALGYFWPEDKAASMRLSFRNLFARLPLSHADVRLLYGVIKKLTKPPK